jgi:hypothetical protein
MPIFFYEELTEQNPQCQIFDEELPEQSPLNPKFDHTLKRRLEKTQTLARKDSNADKKRLKGAQGTTQI